MTSFWATLLQLFATRYNIPPNAFWQLSSREAEALIGGLEQTQQRDAPDRDTFTRLVERFPDEQSSEKR